MGEAGKRALRVGFDRAIKLEFHGARVSSDAGLFPYRDFEEMVELTESAAMELFDIGAITEKDTGGLKLEFGSAEALCAITEQIGKGEGFDP